MCLCKSTGRINGRVEHVRFVGIMPSLSAATYATEQTMWAEGEIECPYCRSASYGRIICVRIISCP